MIELNDREFIARLKQLGIQLGHRDDKLLVSAPTGLIDANLRAELARRKLTLIALLDTSAGRSETAIRSEQGEDSLAPLTFAQQRLWLLDRIFPGNSAYNIPEAFVFDSAVDPDNLQEAANMLIRRHTILTAGILDTGPEPRLRLGSVNSIPVETSDLSHLDESERMSEVLLRIREEGARPFDLTKPPLVRIHLYRLAAELHVVFVNVHHILADRWSVQIMRRELTALYRAAAKREPIHLKPLQMQYADYARQERELLKSGRLSNQIEFWKKQLNAAPSILELPISGPRPVLQSFAGAVQSVAIEGQLYEDLKSLAVQENASLFITLLAAFATLIFRYTGSQDFLIGSPVSGRNLVETEPLVGLFVNTLVLRLRARSNTSFRKFLRTVRSTVLDAHENRDVPFQTLVEELKPERSLGNSPFFQLMFALDSELAPAAGGEVQLDAYADISKFDLTLQLTDQATSISGVFEYRTDLFEAAKIKSLATHFSVLLSAIAAQPDAELGDLSLLPQEERNLLLHDWNRSSEFQSATRTIHERFENQVLANPNLIALIAGDERLCYSELNARANRMAHYLLSKGAGPEVLVGVCLHRTAEMIVALLAVLKSGSAYVPLDPAYPQRRVDYILQDSRLQICITESVLAIAELHPEINCIVVDRHVSSLENQPETNPITQVDSSNASYVIYTSGSTGNPKGVVIEHRNTLGLLDWAANQYTSDGLSGILASTSICFDLSVFEIFLPLSLGKTVILADDLLQLPHLPAANEITLINTVPSALAALLRIHGLPESVRIVNSAGEFLSPELVDRTYASGNVQQVFDLYGPTETTTYSTFTLRQRNAPATIGRPISGTRVYLLDSNRKLVPPGLPGEIYIAGQGVARGYLDRAELTAERFVFLAHRGDAERAYKTGDLARYRPDGNLEYIGRIDHQIKLRGHRIELGEIESALRAKHGVVDAIALVKSQPAPLDDVLVAFVVSDGGAQTATLQESLRAELPLYMIPSKIVEVDKFPLTPNGKVDRHALAAATTLESQHQTFRAPRTRVERQLLHIWEYCFQRDHIGIGDNFFEIGGHSFLASLLFSEIEQRMGKRLMLAVIFQSPTIELLAKQIERGGWQPMPSTIVPISAGGLSSPLYVIESASASTANFKKLGRVLGPAQPLYAVRIPEDGSSIAAGRLIPTLADDLLKFQPRGPHFICGTLNEALHAYSLAQQMESRGSEVTLFLLDPWDSQNGHISALTAQNGMVSSALLRRLNPLRSSREEQLATGLRGRIAIVCANARIDSIRSFWASATSGVVTVETYQEGRGTAIFDERMHTFAAVVWKLLA